MKKLCIDTHGEGERGLPPCSESSSPISIQYENYDGYAVLRDARLVQSLMAPFLVMRNLYVHLRKPSQELRLSSMAVNTEHFSNPCYRDILLEGAVNTNYAGSDIPTPAPLAVHVEISEGIRLADVSEEAITTVNFLTQTLAHSLDVHDNSCMAALITPVQQMASDGSAADASFTTTRTDRGNLKWCRVERCSALRVAFQSPGRGIFNAFVELETILVAHLPEARCIWGKGFIPLNAWSSIWTPFENLQRVHLRSCPRLKFVLPMSAMISLPSLEILHVAHCGELTHIFPVDSSEDQLFVTGEKAIVKEFPKLKRVHLHHLPKLQQVCEFRMSAPVLETVKVRDCWSLRRLPATAAGRRPVVDCEKDWWEKLEWDGLEASHHPSFFQPHHSRYYKKALLRATVLR
ncbi:unnamed protein product [Urochloa humidicola]